MTLVLSLSHSLSLSLNKAGIGLHIGCYFRSTSTHRLHYIIVGVSQSKRSYILVFIPFCCFESQKSCI
ncbi:hypothetical protein LOK49_LG02G01131 [Camellia lanceoleosa]|uniref:Uncharacterized protein n=1 Tax=Camellia lanceoleosa TaxID=1840588 RepID=A0ACC0IT09_9ERIC|nr:hypothetical protein LOK49_LG02G01131 [Camellia lanceoleosa]